MIDDLSSAIFWSIPTIATAVTAVVLGSLAYKDRSKSKMMFTLAFAFASIGYVCWFLMEAGIQVLGLSFRWAFIPMITAIHITAVSDVVMLKNMERAFKGFLLVIIVSTVLMLVQTPILDLAFLLSFGILALVSLTALTVLIMRRRESSDLMLFMSFSCFVFSVIARDVGLVEEYTVILSLFATVFIGLVFLVTGRGTASGLPRSPVVASLIALQHELEKTKEDLKLTRERARAELEVSEEKFRNLCEEARVVMLRVDRKGTITYVNAIVNEYGLERDDLLGKNMLKFVAKKDRLRLFKEHISVIRGNNAEGETEIITSKGKRIVEYASNPVRQGRKIVGCETVLRDITEKREMEKELHAYASRLETMVEEKTIDLRKSEEKLVQYSKYLEKLVEEKTRQLRQAERMAAIGELAGMVGHDLRNPLTGMRGAIHYLRNKYSQKMDGKGKEMLEIVDECINYSNKIINDLLDYSREIQLELKETTPKGLIEASLSMMAIPTSINLVNETRDEPAISVDIDKLKRALCNIVRNAVDAMPEGGKLGIKSTQLKSGVKLVFSDTGVGMTEETIAKLWTPLFTTKAKGMGFGLPISKRIVEAHGGAIKAKSKIGKGTTFELVIPIKPRPDELDNSGTSYAGLPSMIIDENPARQSG